MSLETKVKTVKELTNEIKSVLEDSFPYVWVKGELGSVKLHSSGHKYFSLKEEDYVINGICWRGTPLSVDLEEGKIVECYAKVTIFGGRSSYQIVAKEIREVSSKGDILLKLDELKKTLQKEGVFDKKKGQVIKKTPQKIAILTSPTGAVLHDMIHRINDRFPALYVLFVPISVQGADSKKSILEGLNKADASEVDLIILARGGGSLEDLWIFNEEEIVRKVSSLKLPIITAIGHETDTTLVDYASNLRAPTPTAAIELSIPDSKDLKKELFAFFSSSISYAYEKISYCQKILDPFRDSSVIFENAIENFYQKLDLITSQVNSITRERIKKMELALVGLSDNFFSIYLANLEADLIRASENAFNFMRLMAEQMNLRLKQETLFVLEKEAELKDKVFILSKNNERINSYSQIKELRKESFSLNFIDGSVLVSEK